MSCVDQELLLDIFREENLEALCFHQDGVILKGNAQDDKRNFTGSLILIQRCAWNPSVHGARVHYLIWIPYSYLFCLAPHLVSPAVRRLIDANGDLPLLDRRDLTSHIATKIEWMYTLCLPLTRVARLQRKSNLRGKRIITIFRVGGGSECPLIFQDGGMTKLFDELKKICVVRPLPNSTDEFCIEDLKEPLHSGKPTTEYVDPQVLRKELYSAPGDSPTASSPYAALKSDPSRIPQNASKKSVMGTLLSFGANLTQKGTKIAGSVMQSVYSSGELTGRDEVSLDGSNGFEVIEPVTSVENLIPTITQATAQKDLRPKLSKAEWDLCVTNRERRIDPQRFSLMQEKAFYGGIDDAVRPEVWSYLLKLYPVGSTQQERDVIDKRLAAEYDVLKMQWTTISPEQEKRFAAFRERKSAIEKDVIRTDRMLPEFAADDSPKLLQLHDCLMSYAMFNFDLGYCQGMSDILAVFTLLYHDEWKIFAMFRQMMSERCEGNFRCDVKQNMEKQLQVVELLTKKFSPSLYSHLEKHLAHGMTFCFRWLLILFKREFTLAGTCLVWDVLLSCPFTEQFEIFMVSSMLRAVSAQVIRQALTYDELLKFSNRFSGNVEAKDVIICAQEFYEFVASQIRWKHASGRAAPREQRPRLAEIVDFLKSDSPPPSPTHRSEI